MHFGIVLLSLFYTFPMYLLQIELTLWSVFVSWDDSCGTSSLAIFSWLRVGRRRYARDNTWKGNVGHPCRTQVSQTPVLMNPPKQTDGEKRSSTCGSFATYHMSRNLGRPTLRPRSARSVCDLSYHLALWKPMPRFKTFWDRYFEIFLACKKDHLKGKVQDPVLLILLSSSKICSKLPLHPGAVSFASSFLIAWQQIKSFRHRSSGARTASVEPHLRRPFY